MLANSAWDIPFCSRSSFNLIAKFIFLILSQRGEAVNRIVILLLFVIILLTFTPNCDNILTKRSERCYADNRFGRLGRSLLPIGNTPLTVAAAELLQPGRGEKGIDVMKYLGKKKLFEVLQTTGAVDPRNKLTMKDCKYEFYRGNEWLSFRDYYLLEEDVDTEIRIFSPRQSYLSLSVEKIYVNRHVTIFTKSFFINSIPNFSEALKKIKG